jgi:hypothetical protein
MTNILSGKLEMTKLLAVIKIIQENEQYFTNYLNNSLFNLYTINIIDFNNLNAFTDDIKKLFYFSMSTRQRIRNNPFEDNNTIEIENKVIHSLEILNNAGTTDVSERYYKCLNQLNQIKGAGQKIITMFVKFAVDHSINLNETEELKKRLWIPLDIHLIKFLFTSYYNKGIYLPTNRFNLFSENVNPENLNFTFNNNEPRNNHYFRLQTMVKRQFRDEQIEAPPIILDKLWIIGKTQCNYTKFSTIISCDNCFFKGTFPNNEGIEEPICSRNE